MPDGKVVFEYIGDTSGIDKSNNEAESKVTKGGSKISNAAKGITTAAATAIGGAFVAGTAAAVTFGKKGIELASNLAEVQNVVDTTFGANATSVNDWAKNASAAFGMSELSAKKMNGTMGAMLKSMGLTSDQTVDMSESMVGLAGDFASFYNLDSEDAFNKIRSGISGETEPLKELGINMSEANLSAYALSQGITKSYGSMDQASQAQLRYSYLMSVSKDAQGDFAKTSGGFANQQRILEMQFDSIAATVGTTLLPILTELMGYLTKSLADPSISKGLTDFFNQIVAIAKTALPPLMAAIQQIMPLIGQITSTLLPVLLNLFSSLLPPMIQIISAILPPLVQLISALLPSITQIISQILPIFINLFNTFVPMLLSLVQMILPPLMTLLSAIVPIITQIVSEILPVLATLFQQLMPFFTQLVTDILPMITSIIQQLLPFVMQIISEILPVLIQMFTAIMPTLMQLISAVLPVIMQLIQAILPPLMQLIQELLPPILEIIQALLPIITSLIGLLGPIIQLIASMAATLINALMPIIKLVANIIVNVLSAAIQYLSPIITNVINIITGIVDFIKNVFTENWRGAWDDIIGIFKGIFNQIPSIAEGVINGAIGIINGLIGGINAITGAIGIPSIPRIPRVTLPRFHTGGIVDFKAGEGAALLKSGEMVLTQKQQANLFDIANGWKPNTMSANASMLKPSNSSGAGATVNNFYGPKQQTMQLDVEGKTISDVIQPSMSQLFASGNSEREAAYGE